jgi:hypothetical protein
MNSFISSSQSYFVKGHNLVDDVMVINEVVDFAKRVKRSCLILKVDLKKDYGSVD